MAWCWLFIIGIASIFKCIHIFIEIYRYKTNDKNVYKFIKRVLINTRDK